METELFFLLLFFFTRGGCTSRLRACLGARLLLQSYYYPNLSEGADRVGGQLREDKRVPPQWRNQIWQSLEEGAGKRCSECGSRHPSTSASHFQKGAGKRSRECAFH